MSAHKPFSPQAFRRMVENLSVRQIEKLPREVLPDSIPLEIVEEISDAAKRKVVDSLIWARSANHVTASNSARESLDGSVCDALERAERAQVTGTDELDRLTRQISHNWRTTTAEDDWLDVLTDASLLVEEAEWRAKAQRARLLLYRLMNVYCLQQETSAQRVASNPMSQINAREAIDYYLSSEQFILRYFARKRQEVTLWLAGAAREKLDALDRVRDAILSDYRRTARMRGKADRAETGTGSEAQATG